MTAPAHDGDVALVSAPRCAVVLIDLQASLAGAMPSADWQRVHAAATRLARGAGELGLPVIATRQYPRGLGDLDAAIRGALPPAATVVDKTCFGAGGDDPLGEALAMTGRDQVVLAGMEAHVCVLQSAAALQASGYTPFVAADAVCSRDPDHAANALARLQQHEIEVTNHESALFECLRDAAHPQFKTVAKLLQ